MEKIKIFCNYGVMSAEKRNVYTYSAEHPHATCSDQMIAEIPEGWELYENQMGQMMVTAPWGWNYEIDEVLRGNEIPCFIAIDKSGKERRVFLKVVEEKK